eukprot:SAG31_NODE_21605_length_545_cov_1.163677_1_plen_101_part_10
MPVRGAFEAVCDMVFCKVCPFLCWSPHTVREPALIEELVVEAKARGPQLFGNHRTGGWHSSQSGQRDSKGIFKGIFSICPEFRPCSKSSMPETAMATRLPS